MATDPPPGSSSTPHRRSRPGADGDPGLRPQAAPPPASGVAYTPASRAADPPDPDDAGPAPSGWRVGRLGGIPVYIGSGWIVIALVMVALFGPQVARAIPGVGAAAYLVAAGYAVLLLLSVLVHEAAHAIVARWCGYRVHRVVADLMGGHTAYDASRATPGRSALVAVVGPAANGVIAVAAWLVQPYVTGGIGTILVGALAWTNAFVAVFNLLPGLPLDGGFLLDSLVWKLTGRRHLGLLAAGWAGRIVTVVAVLWLVGRPLLAGAPPSLFTVAWVALLGAFLWTGASRAIATGRARGRLASADLGSVVLPVQTMHARTPLRLTPQTSTDVVVVVDDSGTPLGLLDPGAFGEAVGSGRLDAPAESCLRRMPPTWRLELPRGTGGLGEVVDTMIARRVPALVLYDAGQAYGLVDGRAVDASL